MYTHTAVDLAGDGAAEDVVVAEGDVGGGGVGTTQADLSRS